MLLLIVEDHAGCRTATARSFEARGHTTVTARTAEEALMLVDDFLFEAIICDVRLPDKSGHELMEYLRKEYPNLPGIAISADGTPEVELKSRSAGFSYHFRKPLDFDRLNAAVRSLGN